MTAQKTISVLLVEDDAGDVELTREGLQDSKIIVNLNVVDDGLKALQYLRCEPPYENAGRPDLVLLDLHLPKKDGRDVLRDIKRDETLRSIPVIVLTTSAAESDIVQSYNLGANCYVTKPINFDGFRHVVQTLEQFWFAIVELPGHNAGPKGTN